MNIDNQQLLFVYLLSSIIGVERKKRVLPEKVRIRRTEKERTKERFAFVVL